MLEFAEKLTTNPADMDNTDREALRDVGFSEKDLCQACITGEYPTPYGQDLYQIALKDFESGSVGSRTYETVKAAK